MRNLTQRTIVFFVGIAVLAVVTLVVPFANLLLLNAIAVVVSALGARELGRLFERRDTHFGAGAVVLPVLGGLLPLVQLLILNGLLPDAALLFTIYAVVSMTLLLQIFRRSVDAFADTLTNTAATITVFLYPGLFVSYFVRLSSFANPGPLVLLFLCTVFFNDTLAFLAGSLYRSLRSKLSGGRWSPTVLIPASPNKTIVGFVAGLAGAPVTILVAMRLFPTVFPGRPAHALVFGAAIGAATIAGDLIESALKRSATSKDSGSIIPGRGGILDSADSVLYAAPVFYYLLAYVV
ncbi:MAG: hypothetical protein EA382_16585 [Spirochaetaceae bacterium]|nr:MAG: hypothetical protein EA382_16585 [Spirochaetaceae bacterium]